MLIGSVNRVRCIGAIEVFIGHALIVIMHLVNMQANVMPNNRVG